MGWSVACRRTLFEILGWALVGRLEGPQCTKVYVRVSPQRTVICPAPTHTAQVSSASLAVLCVFIYRHLLHGPFGDTIKRGQPTCVVHTLEAGCEDCVQSKRR